MESILLLQKILLALAIGALIGIERERRRIREEIFAGVRTFMLTCLFGLLTGYLSQLFSSCLPIYIGLATVCSIAIVSYGLKSAKTRRVGLTTRTAFILAFIIGVIVFYEDYPYLISISLGVITTLLLLSKESLHKFARGLKKNEIRDAILFAIIAFIILPLLPNKPLDPFSAINPYVVWLVVVAILGISFFAYVAIKALGSHGLVLTGLFGGFSSSTQLALVVANDVKRHKRLLYSSAFAVVIASSLMFFRQIIISLFFNVSLVQAIIPFSLVGGLGISLSYLLWKKSKKEKASISLSSPLALKPAFGFLAYLVFILLLTGFVRKYFAPEAIYLVAFLNGLVDVDAITISLATASASGLSPLVAVNGMLIAATTNTLSKWFLIKWVGAEKLAEEVKKFFLALIVVCVFLLAIQVL
jgi:uncharacterized membrane protein (DUF4010 family)